MRAKTVCLIWLIVLMIADILPVPVIGLILLYVIFNRPQWFRRLVDRLYREN